MKDEIKKIEGFGQQVILYSKGWYGRSGKGAIHDLMRLLAKYSNSDLEYISEKDAWEILCRTAGDCVSRFDIGEALYETVGGKWKGFIDRKPENVLIGKISIVDGGYVDMADKMDFSLETT